MPTMFDTHSCGPFTAASLMHHSHFCLQFVLRTWGERDPVSNEVRRYFRAHKYCRYMMLEILVLVQLVFGSDVYFSYTPLRAS
jgi:hypothetical protein